MTQPGSGEQLGCTVYTQPLGAPRETTEWGDAQRRLGNYAPLEPEPPRPAWQPAADALVSAAAREEEAAELEALRQRRLSALRAAAQRPRHGALLFLPDAAAYTREVTAASLRCDVVLLVTRSGHAGCDAAQAALATIARRSSALKCLVCDAAAAVSGGRLPDSALPQLLLYRRGEVVLQHAGTAWAGPSHRHLTPEVLAAALDGTGRRVCVTVEEAAAAEEEAREAEGRRAAAAAVEEEGSDFEE